MTTGAILTINSSRRQLMSWKLRWRPSGKSRYHIMMIIPLPFKETPFGGSSCKKLWCVCDEGDEDKELGEPFTLDDVFQLTPRKFVAQWLPGRYTSSIQSANHQLHCSVGALGGGRSGRVTPSRDDTRMRFIFLWPNSQRRLDRRHADRVGVVTRRHLFRGRLLKRGKSRQFYEEK